MAKLKKITDGITQDDLDSYVIYCMDCFPSPILMQVKLKHGYGIEASLKEIEDSVNRLFENKKIKVVSFKINRSRFLPLVKVVPSTSEPQ